MWNLQSISIKWMVSIILIIASAINIALLSFFTFNDNKVILTKQINRTYNAKALHAKERIEDQLLFIQSNLLRLANHTLLTNSLTDELGREIYLPKMLKSFGIHGVQKEIFISLHDFEGNLIDSNHSESFSKVLAHLDKSIITGDTIRRVQNYRSFIHIDNKPHYLLAVPVLYGESPKGFLLLILEWEDLWNKLLEPHKDIELSLKLGEQLIASTGSMLEQGIKKQLPIDSFPNLVLITKVPRSQITDPIHHMQQRALFWGFLLLIMTLVVNIFWIAKKVSAPIVELKKATAKVASGKWDHVVLKGASKDMQDLAHEFNLMTNQLKVAQEELQESYQQLEEEKDKQLKSAYTAGMAETAIGVLHNVGNILTPTVVNLDKLSDIKELEEAHNYLRKIHETLLKKLEEQHLESFLREDSKGQQLLPFFENVIASLQKHQESHQHLVFQLEHQLQHITDIILLQQKYANFKREQELIELIAPLEDAIEMMEPAFEKRSIQIHKSFEPSLPSLMCDRNKLVQVLLNLFKNAVESIDEQLRATPESQPEISVSTRLLESEYIQVCIQDTGYGVELDKLSSVFQFGFSTKQRGSGFGLHDCANFIRSYDGEIQIISDGVGKGATVCFILPVEKQRSNVPQNGG